MNDPRDESEQSAAPAAAAPSETIADGDAAVTAAPKRRKPRATEAPAAGGLPGEGGETVADVAASEAPPAARRRTRRPAAQAAAEESASAGGDATAPAADEPVATEVRAPRQRRSRQAAAADHARASAAIDAQTPQGELPPPPADQTGAGERAGAPAPAVVSTDDGERGQASERGFSGVADDGADAAQFGAPMAPVADVAERFEDVISGQYDEEGSVTEVEEAEVTKRVLRPEPEAPKLHKVLAQAGIGSRRDMEALIEEGQVTVNGEPAHLGMRITYGDQIAVAGKPVKVRIAPAAARVLAYHKPVGEVVTHHDPEGRPTVFRRLPRLNRGKWLSVGRLDLNTEGLLLFTNSGDLANQLMHPRFGVEREYAVRVLGELDEGARNQLLAGVEIDGQKAAFKSIEDGGGEGANHWWRVVITEGRNREVRKLFDVVGLTVSRLIRIRYGTVVLPRGLKRGVWVELDDNDVRQIRRLAGNEQQRRQGGPEGQGPREGAQGDRRGGRRNKQRRNQPGGPEGARAPQQANVAGPQRGPGGGPNNGPQGRGQQGPGRGGPRERPLPVYDEHREADDPLHIPNPLEQTFDRRFATGSKRIAAGFGRPSDDASRGGPAAGRKGGPREPDPMQTSVGYIGADAYFQKPGGGNKRGRRR